jgi:hypothetical protein
MLRDRRLPSRTTTTCSHNLLQHYISSHNLPQLQQIANAIKQKATSPKEEEVSEGINTNIIMIEDSENKFHGSFNEIPRQIGTCHKTSPPTSLRTLKLHSKEILSLHPFSFQS